jgi:hypothetical protein
MSYRFCDVILRVGKDEVYAHSNVLAAASPYFGTFLGHGPFWNFCCYLLLKRLVINAIFIKNNILEQNL